MSDALNKVIPLIIFVGLIIGAIAIFYLFNFLSSNFWLLLIGAIVLIPMLGFGFWFFKMNKNQDTKPLFSVLLVFLFVFTISPQYVDAEVVPLDSVSTRLDKEDIDQLRTDFNTKLTTLQADISTIKTQSQQQKSSDVGETPDYLLVAFPIVLVQILSTAIILLYLRTKD